MLIPESGREADDGAGVRAPRLCGRRKTSRRTPRKQPRLFKQRVKRRDPKDELRPNVSPGLKSGAFSVLFGRRGRPGGEPLHPRGRTKPGKTGKGMHGVTQKRRFRTQERALRFIRAFASPTFLVFTAWWRALRWCFRFFARPL